MSSISAERPGMVGAMVSGRYRRLTHSSDLVAFQIGMEQSDLQISAARRMPREALVLLGEARAQVTGYIARVPEFLTALDPIAADASAPPVVAAMIAGAAQAKVGPMAAVAGAIAEYVGRGLAREGGDVIVENGGDVFLMSARSREVAVLAENSLLGGLRIVVPPCPEGAGLATSAGTLGPSRSLGRADAVTILAADAAHADALATGIGNIVHAAGDIAGALETARAQGALGAIIIAGGSMGAWGALRLADRGACP